METELKQKIERIVEKLEESEGPFYEACKELKALIEPEKWEPKNIASFSQEIHDKYYAMEERNRRIFLAKAEKGFGDGSWLIARGYGFEWQSFRIECVGLPFPENTFTTKEQADEVIKMVELNG